MNAQAMSIQQQAILLKEDDPLRALLLEQAGAIRKAALTIQAALN
jgi:hypothetical protein